MRTWGLVLVALLPGCGGMSFGWVDDDQLAIDDAEYSDVVQSPVEPEAHVVRTICADTVAREIDSTLEDTIGTALEFWQSVRQPEAEWMRHDPGAARCDIRVYFSGEEGSWKDKEMARAKIAGTWEPGCTPRWIALRELHWETVRAEDWAFGVLVHEIGHLLCLPHAESGPMQPDGGLD